jgi:hypothetical protein
VSDQIQHRDVTDARVEVRRQDFYVEWERLAGDTVALLRAEAGRDPYDKGLTDLIGELSTRSELFRTWWAAHNVRLHRTGVKRFHHPAVGDLTLAYESMDLTAVPQHVGHGERRRTRWRRAGPDRHRPHAGDRLGHDHQHPVR